MAIAPLPHDYDEFLRAFIARTCAESGVSEVLDDDDTISIIATALLDEGRG
jgi:hypothetical protein